MKKVIILIFLLSFSGIAQATPRDDLMLAVQDPNQMSMDIGDSTFRTQSLRLLEEISINVLPGQPKVDIIGVNGVTPSVNNGPTDPGTLRVSISSDSAGKIGVNNFPAVQPVTGTLTIIPSASALGGSLTFHRISTAGTNAVVVKNSPGNVFAVQLYNTTGPVKFVKFYNKATLPVVGVDIPVKTIAIKGNDERTIFVGLAGANFPLGIGIGMTTGALDNNAAPVGAGDIIADIDYK